MCGCRIGWDGGDDGGCWVGESGIGCDGGGGVAGDGEVNEGCGIGWDGCDGDRG